MSSPKKSIIVALASALVVGRAVAGDLPDARLTPGAVNPAVTQSTIQETVCVKGWTKIVRPPATYTDALKKVQIGEYGYADTNPATYEEDHLIPLALGGHPTDPKNLWPQPRTSQWNAARKDHLEFALYKAVCNSELVLDEARNAIKSDWISAYGKYRAFLDKYGSQYLLSAADF